MPPGNTANTDSAEGADLDLEFQVHEDAGPDQLVCVLAAYLRRLRDRADHDLAARRTGA
jgi:hypothetical protein